ncbi:DUF6766 domain-containing protein [Deinococcus deserti]|uniref:Transmembrane protein n=1 Tax=Deinococcus deserti (strain DSM 17065 / CIP 109153 / LMG 22923 / VCD115) TaxID=546414 RepID=C1D304_DEIDV|nr:DUF6766 family protein [Deinococcus deserti]ACO47793.1 Conserved hypothetical protein, precursor; putative membrane protein [Deinococcus deserti VCD115]
MKKFWSDNALSIVLMIFFFVLWAGQAISGWAVHNQELEELKQRSLSLGEYLLSSHFWSTTTENWESEFLQMAAFVVLTVYLRQRGSAESNPYPEEETKEQREKNRRDSAVRGFWKRNSLTVTLFGLFFISLLLHFVSSMRNFNHERLAQGHDPLPLGEFLKEPTFWFESAQNWQSEFLAVTAIVVLTIFLRQIGSSQSKALDDPNEKTGDS